jgi:hypothetical protein
MLGERGPGGRETGCLHPIHPMPVQCSRGPPRPPPPATHTHTHTPALLRAQLGPCASPAGTAADRPRPSRCLPACLILLQVAVASAVGSAAMLAAVVIAVAKLLLQPPTLEQGGCGAPPGSGGGGGGGGEPPMRLGGAHTDIIAHTSFPTAMVRFPVVVEGQG